MRRFVLSVVTCCALVAIVPASALAHSNHHKRHHHRGHHGRVIDRSWGGGTQSQNQSQDAGTVQSFTGGVLTVALANGQTVSGQVTDATEIECQAADMSSGWQSHDQGGDSNSGNSSGDDDQGQGDDDNGNGNASCDSSSLTPGAVVHEAELRVSGAGAVWDKVELATQSSQGSQSSTGSDS